MTIALLVHDYHRAGGHSRYVAELATRWARDHKVHVFANTWEPEPGVTFHQVPANRSNALALILTFRSNASRLLARMQFDIVHDQGLCIGQPNVITAHIVNRAWGQARPDAPAKDRVFSTVIGGLEYLQYRRAGSAEVIAVSDRVRRDLESCYGFQGHLTVIHHGVDAAKFTPDTRNAKLRNELGVPQGVPLYLFAGDFRKGVEPAIRALESGHLVCVGSTVPEPYRTLAQQLGRSDRVHFRPATDTIEDYYAGADVLLLPTPYDAFGMVVLEAMAAGLPIVVSRNAGASELIEHGVNGFVLQDNRHLPALMQQAAQSTVGVAARQTALEHSWDRVAAETLAVYHRAAQRPKLLAFATQDIGGNDETRLRALLENHPADWFPFRRAAPFSLLRHILTHHYELVAMEGTGISGGLLLLLARLLIGQRYLVGSGDAVGPFVSQKQPLLGPLFSLYERLLYGNASGFIGWSPYLTGRALTFGVPRAATAAGWAPAPSLSTKGPQIRRELSIPEQALVVGIAGSLTWTPRVRYCYGLELVRAAALTPRPDLRFLIVGDGSGRPELRRHPDPRVILTGHIPRERVPDYLAAMDIASLPQSCDGVGSFRLTTKLSEYLAAGLPVITGQIPTAYDLDDGWLWRLPGDAPWSPRYIEALAQLLDTLTPEALAERRARVPVALSIFDREAQVRRVTALIDDILSR